MTGDQLRRKTRARVAETGPSPNRVQDSSLSNPSISDRVCWSPDFSATPIPMESCASPKLGSTELHFCNNVIDFKVDRYFGKRQCSESQRSLAAGQRAALQQLRYRRTGQARLLHRTAQPNRCDGP